MPNFNKHYVLSAYTTSYMPSRPLLSDYIEADHILARMHWHDLRHPPSTKGNPIPQLDGRDLEDQSEAAVTEDTPEPPTRECEIPYGNDDAADIKAELPRPDILVYVNNEPTSAADDDGDDNNIFPVQIPFLTHGLCTAGYQRALQTRLKTADIRPHGCWDTTPYKPVFIHDILMQPGSLANIIGDLSPEQLITRMTPALLPGHYPHVDSDTHLPFILPSANPSDYVQGMLLVGEGRNGRKAIHRHYTAALPHTHRVQLPVQIDVLVPVPEHETRVFPGQRWKLKRRTVMARVWVARGEGLAWRVGGGRWSLGGYLGGEMDGGQRMDLREAGEWEDCEVEVAGTGEEEEEEEKEEEEEEEEREVVVGGWGLLDYGRCKGFAGW
ncbi:hypothetical protein EJ03DRAFT_371586 [Teratosphaeria nubilosa]|uniref:Uncharacterized protein n=1 Tax=Teratosphaeria nubilosa TaxID=161662 RepID=A0A6G1LJL5_9PEZI|nr:hypothetical protein EJ03DRAFT_371586 [Teratosphaeria nubilosa]